MRRESTVEMFPEHFDFEWNQDVLDFIDDYKHILEGEEAEAVFLSHDLGRNDYEIADTLRISQRDVVRLFESAQQKIIDCLIDEYGDFADSIQL